ncbi:MAG: EthD family reductase [Saprospiraceae bacterium]|nr:EthD family reductase [Saprospiraceae bacterium]
MISVSIYYPNANDIRFDLEYFRTKHLPMIDHLLNPMGLQKVIVEQGIGTPMPSEPAPYAVITRLLFNNIEEMEMGMGHCGTALMDDVANFFNHQPIVQISREL